MKAWKTLMISLGMNLKKNARASTENYVPNIRRPMLTTGLWKWANFQMNGRFWFTSCSFESWYFAHITMTIPIIHMNLCRREFLGKDYKILWQGLTNIGYTQSLVGRIQLLILIVLISETFKVTILLREWILLYWHFYKANFSRVLITLQHYIVDIVK